MSSKKAVRHVHELNLDLSNVDTFQWLYERHHIAVFRYIYGLRGGPLQDIEDLTTNTFLKAWRSRRRFKGDQNNALSWLLKIARNLVIDRYRKEKTPGDLLDIDNQILTNDERPPEDQLYDKETIRILEESLDKLSDLHKDMIVLRYILGWRVKEIADHLEMKENNVSVTIKRILKRLQEAWPEIE